MAEIVEKISKKLFERSALQTFCCIPSPATPPMLVEAYRRQNFIFKNLTNSSWPILPGNRSKRSGTSLVSVTAFDLKLYRIKNWEKMVVTTRNVNMKKDNINEDAFISLKSLFLLHGVFNFFINSLLSVAVFLTHGSAFQRDTINSIHFVGGGWRVSPRPSARCFLSLICRVTLSWLQEIGSERTLSPNHISHIINPKLYMSTLES